MYHLLGCLRKKNYRYIGISVILSPIAGFLSPVRVTQLGYFVSLIISTSNRSVFCVFYDCKALYLIISVLLPRLVCFYIFFSAILKIPTQVFLMPVRGAGYTLLTLYK